MGWRRPFYVSFFNKQEVDMDEEFSLQDYQAALSGAAFYRIPRSGYHRLRGVDRLAFLQRQTTNDVTLLSPSQSVLTVLTNPAARILDVLRLIHESDEEIGLVTLPGQAGETFRFLKSRIFFKDHVSLVDASPEMAQIDLGGPSAASLLAGLGLPDLTEPGVVVRSEIVGVAVRAIEQPGFDRTGYRLLVPSAECESLDAALVRQGAIRLSEASYHVLRVENGLPAAGAELTGDYTPLEMGLEAEVSTTKGCYTGQEVIARQLNYDKVTQHLALLRLQAPGQAGERLWVDGRPVGLLTTVAQSPRFGPLALAVIKRPYHQPGTSVIIGGDGTSGGTSAEVAELPLTHPG
jgi:folate-binding protein YgfZ